jgi:hypothetical protein
VAILALFPVGLRSANDSRVETIVVQIARTVLSDLRTGNFQAARVMLVPLPEDLAAPAAPPSASAVSPYDLSQAVGAVKYVAYSSDGTPTYKDKNSNPAPSRREPIAVNYTHGTPDADFIVKIESRLVSTTAPALAQVTVTVESPAIAPVAYRTKYPVVTLMGDMR